MPRKRSRGRPKKAAADLYVACRVGLPRNVYRQVSARAKILSQPTVVVIRARDVSALAGEARGR